MTTHRTMVIDGGFGHLWPRAGPRVERRTVPSAAAAILAWSSTTGVTIVRVPMTIAASPIDDHVVIYGEHGHLWRKGAPYAASRRIGSRRHAAPAWCEHSQERTAM